MKSKQLHLKIKVSCSSLLLLMPGNTYDSQAGASYPAFARLQELERVTAALFSCLSPSPQTQKQNNVFFSMFDCWGGERGPLGYGALENWVTFWETERKTLFYAKKKKMSPCLVLGPNPLPLVGSPVAVYPPHASQVPGTRTLTCLGGPQGQHPKDPDARSCVLLTQKCPQQLEMEPSQAQVTVTVVQHRK